MRYQGVQFKEALAFLRNVYQGSFFDRPARAGGASRNPSSLIPFQQQSQQEQFGPEGHRELEFLEAHEIQNPVILSYLEEQRKIPGDLARLYLKEVKYRKIPNDKIFFAFGMENESGGYANCRASGIPAVVPTSDFRLRTSVQSWTDSQPFTQSDELQYLIPHTEHDLLIGQANCHTSLSNCPSSFIRKHLHNVAPWP